MLWSVPYWYLAFYNVTLYRCISCDVGLLSHIKYPCLLFFKFTFHTANSHKSRVWWSLYFQDTWDKLPYLKNGQDDLFCIDAMHYEWLWPWIISQPWSNQYIQNMLIFVEPTDWGIYHFNPFILDRDMLVFNWADWKVYRCDEYISQTLLLYQLHHQRWISYSENH